MRVSRLLVPIDGSERSMRSLEFLKNTYRPDNTEVTVMMVSDIMVIDADVLSGAEKSAEKEARKALEKAEKLLEGYDVKTYFKFGRPGEEIIKKSITDKSDVIIMTKSNKTGLARMVGSVTSYVLKNTIATVTVIPQ